MVKVGDNAVLILLAVGFFVCLGGGFYLTVVAFPSVLQQNNECYANIPPTSAWLCDNLFLPKMSEINQAASMLIGATFGFGISGGLFIWLLDKRTNVEATTR